ncbi:hypothetical protein HPB52_007000 [Rhipicephalus sanguineus]|uniref:Uncharacterized protein n=1 Tax=Rhipicephalus sanguineus TaxID=34632 RepID=A0A9D4SW46_RHISA|nr:hypothetical protein HPB52_007000 [Rhipicephalus sanguineus]
MTSDSGSVEAGDPYGFESAMSMMQDSTVEGQDSSGDDGGDVEGDSDNRDKENKDTYQRDAPVPVEIRVGQETTGKPSPPVPVSTTSSPVTPPVPSKPQSTLPPPRPMTPKPVPTPPARKTTLTTVTPAPPKVTSATTPTIPRTIKEVMCTVGHTAVAKIMYPPDGVCQYLFYTDVVIVDGAIRASREQNSWKFFQMNAKRYKKMKSGIAFDHRYTTSKLLSDATQQLKTLANEKKIHSYGLLNIIRKPGDLRGVMRSMQPVVETLKQMQGSDPEKRTVVAMGSYDYSTSSFMNMYKKIFADVVK